MAAEEGTFMAELKQRLQADLVTAIKAHDEPVKAALRMALSAIGTEEVAGVEARDLTADEELAVLTKEVAKRKDSAEAYAAGGRDDLVANETKAISVLQVYLPQPLTEAELSEIVAAEVAAVAAQLGAEPTMRNMGQVMKGVTAKVAGRADGALAAAKVKAALS